MKLLLILVSVGIAAAGIIEESDFDKTLYFLDCCRKAMDGGVPSIPIPDHRNLKVRDFHYNVSSLGTTLELNLTNNLLLGLVDYNFTNLVPTSYGDSAINFDYDLYWPLLNFTGDLSYKYKVPLVNPVEHSGTFNLVLHHTDFVGIFNLTKPGQENVAETLSDFTLDIGVKTIDLTVPGLNFFERAILKSVMYYAINHVPAAAGEFLRTERFNDFWIGHPERIDALLDFCKNN